MYCLFGGLWKGAGWSRATSDKWCIRRCHGYRSGPTGFTNGPRLLLIAEAFDSCPGRHLLSERQDKQFPWEKKKKNRHSRPSSNSYFQLSACCEEEARRGNIRSQMHIFPLRQRFRDLFCFIYLYIFQSDMAPKLYFTLQSTSAPVRLLFLLCRLNFELTLKDYPGCFFSHTVASLQHWRSALALFAWTEVQKRGN